MAEITMKTMGIGLYSMNKYAGTLNANKMNNRTKIMFKPSRCILYFIFTMLSILIYKGSNNFANYQKAAQIRDIGSEIRL